jgi:hypothetical protein
LIERLEKSELSREVELRSILRKRRILNVASDLSTPGRMKLEGCCSNCH